MTIEVANILLDARDDMTGVEIALVTVIRNLQKRVEELEREKADRIARDGSGCTTEPATANRGSWIDANFRSKGNIDNKRKGEANNERSREVSDQHTGGSNPAV
jgi:hypothetical protein